MPPATHVSAKPVTSRLEADGGRSKPSRRRSGSDEPERDLSNLLPTAAERQLIRKLENRVGLYLSDAAFELLARCRCEGIGAVEASKRLGIGANACADALRIITGADMQNLAHLAPRGQDVAAHP